MTTKRKKSHRERMKQAAKDQGMTMEELEAIEHDCLVGMVGEDDAAYLEAAGIDDIGCK